MDLLGNPIQSSCSFYCKWGGFQNVPFENNVAIRCANFKSSLSRFRANTTFYNFSTTFAPNQTEQEDTMESKKLEKPRKNGAFSTIQGVMKPDEETGGVFPTMKPLD